MSIAIITLEWPIVKELGVKFYQKSTFLPMILWQFSDANALNPISVARRILLQNLIRFVLCPPDKIRILNVNF